MPVQKVDEEDRRGILPRRKKEEKRRTRTGESGLHAQGYFHTARYARARSSSVSGVRPKLRCGKLDPGIDRSCGIGMQLIMHIGRAHMIFAKCARRIAPHASRATNRMLVRARCIVLRSAARGYAPSIVNIARGHSCDDVHGTKTRLLVHFSPLTPCIVKENPSLLHRRGCIALVHRGLIPSNGKNVRNDFTSLGFLLLKFRNSGTLFT